MALRGAEPLGCALGDGLMGIMVDDCEVACVPHVFACGVAA